jgi:hypothetical protein
MPEVTPPPIQLSDPLPFPAPDAHLDHEHPWPGLISFSEADHSFFFGREREVAELARIIRQKMVTVFFGKSGLGKSSILRAGVTPLLREAEFIPVYIRLNHDEAAPPLEDQVEIAIEQILAQQQVEGPTPVRAETLWEYFHKKDNEWWDQENRRVKPVLIFDQFEELLTLGQSTPERAGRSAAFLEELEDLVENRAPAALQRRFEAERGLARNYDLERADYRVVLTLREDFLPDLEGLRERLRAIMFNRFRLLPMTGEQAMDVVLKPGGHLVDEDVAVRIIDFVSSSERSRMQRLVTRGQLAKRSIEPALLSVVLQELNNRRILAGQEKITSELVGQTNPTEIFHDFYLRGLEGMDGEVRNFIEDCLLTSSGARNRIAEEDALTRKGISTEIVAKLIDRRIVQREMTGNTKWLELTHDTLADVVRSDRSEHQQQRELALAAAREREARQKLRRVQKLALAFAGLLIAAVLALIYAFGQKRKAETAQEFTTRATDELALGILRNVEQNPRIRVDDKLFLADRLSGTVQRLRSAGGTSANLSLRLADLCATASVMLFECGRIDEATEYARTAQSLIAAPGKMSQSDALIRARVQLATGLSQRYTWKLKDAEKTFSEAEAELEKAPVRPATAASVAVLKGKLVAAWSDTLTYMGSAERGEKLALTGITETESELDSIKDEGMRRSLAQELLRLHMCRYRAVKIGDLSAEMSDMHERFAEALKKTKLHFLNEEDPVWRYFEAKSIQAEVVLQKHTGAQDEAVKSIALAAKNLHSLLVDDPQNIWFRAELGSALMQQAELAKATGDTEQQKLDRDATYKLAMAILRDQQAPYFSYQLAGFVDGDQGTLEAAARYLARTDLEAKQLGPNDTIMGMQLDAHENCMSRMLEKKKYQEAIQQVEAGLAILDRLDSLGEKTLGRRIDLLGEFLRADANAVGRDRWMKIYERAQETLKRLELKGSQTTVAWVTSMRGDQHLRDKEYKESVLLFQQAKEIYLTAIKGNKDSEMALQNYLYMAAKLITGYSGLGDWQRAAAVCREARTQTGDTLKAHPEITRILGYLQLVADAIDDADKAAHEQSVDAKRAGQLSAEVAATKEQIEALTRRNANQAEPAVAAAPIDLRRSALDDLRTGVSENQNYILVKQRLGWSDSPIYPGPWRTISGKEFEDIASHLLLPEGISSRQIERIRTSPLNFYPDGQLIEAEYIDAKGSSLTVSAFSAHGKVYRLNGTSPPIHEANADAPLRLANADDAVAYLRFFCTYVRGEEGSFQIVESAGDLPWASWAPPDLKANVERLLRPLVTWPDPEGGGWLATASIQYSNALFHSLFSIRTSGLLEMKEDKPVANDLPFDVVVYKEQGRAGRLEMLDLRSINPPLGDTEVDVRLKMAESKDHKPKDYLRLADEAAELQSDITSILNDESSKDTLQDVLNRTYDLHDKAGDKAGAAKWRAQLGPKRELELLVRDGWNQLLAKNFDEALALTEKGLRIDPGNLLLQSNRAHALLFLGRTTEADEIYRKYIGQTVKPTTQSWENTILTDFDQLEKAGISRPELNQIREYLKASRPAASPQPTSPAQSSESAANGLK